MLILGERKGGFNKTTEKLRFGPVCFWFFVFFLLLFTCFGAVLLFSLAYLKCSAPLLECKSLLVQVIGLVYEQLNAFSTLQNTL